MKIYIVTDMEGVSGICNEEQVRRGSPEYETARALLEADVNAAVDGAIAGGAAEVVVNDGHGGGFNFRLEAMDPRAVYERPNGALDLLPSLDASFAGVFCVGYHAMAGTLNGFLDHTQSSAAWFQYELNGRPTGELGQIGAWAGALGVPVLLVTGDQAACDEGRAFFGDLATAAVKQGLGRQGARCLAPAEARRRIREAARVAVGRAGSVAPYVVERPLTVRLTYYRSDMADAAASRPGVRRVDARTVERVTDDVRQILAF